MDYLKYFISTLLIFSSISAHAERNFTDVSLKTIKVHANVYMLEGVNGFAGGNIAVSIGSDGILIVDDQFAPMADKIKAALSDLGQGELRFILNTHWHGDHTGGNIVFSDHATVIAHDNVRKRLMSLQKNDFGESPAQPKEAWPVITFEQSVNIHFNDETINVIHFPNGHTDSDSIVYFTGANVVHMGDHFFAGAFPFIDLNSNGNAVHYANNIGRILAMLPDDVMVIPGHGHLSTKKDLMAYHKMLNDSIAFVKQYKADGKSLSDIQTMGLPESLKKWETGFIKQDNWIKFIYQSLDSV